MREADKLQTLGTDTYAYVTRMLFAPIPSKPSQRLAKEFKELSDEQVMFLDQQIDALPKCSSSSLRERDRAREENRQSPCISRLALSQPLTHPAGLGPGVRCEWK